MTLWGHIALCLEASWELISYLTGICHVRILLRHIVLFETSSITQDCLNSSVVFVNAALWVLIVPPLAPHQPTPDTTFDMAVRPLKLVH